MKLWVSMLAAASLLAAGGAVAAEGADLLKAKGCANCHDMDKKKAGPALKDIAAKHKDDKEAETRIIAKLKSGKGHPKANASDAELKAMVGYVLTGK